MLHMEEKCYIVFQSTGQLRHCSPPSTTKHWIVFNNQRQICKILYTKYVLLSTVTENVCIHIKMC